MKKMSVFCRSSLCGALVAAVCIAQPAHAQTNPAPSVAFDDGALGVGSGALGSISTNVGGQNTAIGTSALGSIQSNGIVNTALGFYALVNSVDGSYNTALGAAALQNLVSGINNIGIGLYGGAGLTNTSDNIMIGNTGNVNDSATIRLGVTNLQTRAFVAGIAGVTLSNAAPVVVRADGQLGTAALLTGQYVLLPTTAPAPAGYTLVGTTTFKYKHLVEGKSKSAKAELNVYQQN